MAPFIFQNFSVASRAFLKFDRVLLKINLVIANMTMEIREREVFMHRLFYTLANEDNKTVYLRELFALVFKSGLRKDDPRLQKFFERALITQTGKDHYDDSEPHLTEDEFMNCVRDGGEMVGKAVVEDFIVPEFDQCVQVFTEIYEKFKVLDEGHVSTSIPQLARADPNLWGVSVCTIDGQRISLGDANQLFCMQSLCLPLIYAMALNELSTDFVHKYVGKEPSGRSSNELSLDYNNKPHNPLITSGGLAVLSLIRNESSVSDRYDYIFNEIRKIAGSTQISFSNSVFLSEREQADRNWAIGHFLNEHNAFPCKDKLADTLDLFFQSCSIEGNCDSIAVIAATLANGGICPLTGEKVLHGESVRNTLSLMHSCGMQDYSGQFAFTVGLPAKSSVSGAIMVQFFFLVLHAFLNT